MDLEISKYIEICKQHQQQIRQPIRPTPPTNHYLPDPNHRQVTILTKEKRRLIIEICGIDPLTGCVYGSTTPCIIEKNYRELWEVYQSRTRHPKYVIDHINGCNYDNSIWNLREITTHDNRKNRAPYYEPVPSHNWENTLPPIPLEYEIHQSTNQSTNQSTHLPTQQPLNQLFPDYIPCVSITRIFEHYADSLLELAMLGLQYIEIKSLCKTKSETLTINFNITTIKSHFTEEVKHYNDCRVKQIKSNLNKNLLTF